MIGASARQRAAETAKSNTARSDDSAPQEIRSDAAAAASAGNPLEQNSAPRVGIGCLLLLGDAHGWRGLNRPEHVDHGATDRADGGELLGSGRRSTAAISATSPRPRSRRGRSTSTSSARRGTKTMLNSLGAPLVSATSSRITSLAGFSGPHDGDRHALRDRGACTSKRSRRAASAASAYRREQIGVVVGSDGRHRRCSARH